MPPLDLQIPPHLIANQQHYHGEDGLHWIEALPALAAEVAQRWGLILEAPFTAGQVDYTAPVRRTDGSEAVLKLCYVDLYLRPAVAALRAFDGNAAVRLLDADLESGALLLERLVPGEPISVITDDTAAMHEAAELLRHLWQAPADAVDFLSLDSWLDDANLDERLPATKRGHPWVARLLAQAHALVTTSTQRCLLHGDFHQDNVLSSQRGWLAVDPKGIFGDPAWDLAALLFNNLEPAGDAWRPLIRRRLDQLCDELGLDRRRAYTLCAARALQSRFWSLRDTAEPRDASVERAFHVGEELAKGP
jgi:streptomycin 6-kinase